jgi:hypothetical protein
MTQTGLDEAMIQELLDADVAFIDAVQKALGDFHASAPAGWQQWESWRKPDPWKDKVLPHLQKYREWSEEALREWKKGNPAPAVEAATGQMGLSKKIDFDLDWATPENRQALEAALDRVAAAADRIWRLTRPQP